MKELLLLISFLFLPTWANASDVHYRVLHVVDGDTFDATDGNIKFRVRIAGMDAPEYKQAFGKSATIELKNLIEGKDVVIQPVERGLDKYDRVLGQVLSDGKDVSLLMIQGGFAFYYRPRCRDYPDDKQLYQYDPRPYVQAEATARAAHLIVWSQGTGLLPCQFRKENPH